MTATDPTIDICNELLRGEISAVETYTQAIEAFDPGGSDTALQRIRSDHQQNVAELRQLVSENAGDPATGSGAWGNFVKAVEGAAVLLGESPALRILQTGESHGISQYENALANEELSHETRSAIRRMVARLHPHLIELQQRRDREA